VKSTGLSPATTNAQPTRPDLGPGLYSVPVHTYRKRRSFIPAFAGVAAGMHGVAFRRASFVNDALEEAANRGVG
jgi:hypothetical protein